jgi:hypothetical protein
LRHSCKQHLPIFRINKKHYLLKKYVYYHSYTYFVIFSNVLNLASLVSFSLLSDFVNIYTSPLLPANFYWQALDQGNVMLSLCLIN